MYVTTTGMEHGLINKLQSYIFTNAYSGDVYFESLLVFLFNAVPYTISQKLS